MDDPTSQARLNSPDSARRRAAALLPAPLAGVACGVLILLALPRSLGTLYAALVASLVLVPVLVLCQQGRWARLAAPLGFSIPLALACAALVHSGQLLFSEWLLAALVQVLWALALGGAANLLRMCRLPSPGASALTVLAGALWLAWPVWMAPLLQGPGAEHTVARLVTAHPAFVLNGRLPRAFPVPWAQYRLAYELTNIGDDVPYEMPDCIGPFVLLHALLALGLLLPGGGGAELRAEPAPEPVAAPA